MTFLLLYLAVGVAATAWFYLLHAPSCDGCRCLHRSDLYIAPVNVVLWPVWVALRIAGVIR